MTRSTDDRLRTGGAFEALPDYEVQLEAKLRGRVLSGYKVGRIVGSGGMGYVFHATRAEGDFDRVAAIKVVVAAHNTSELARRFRMEVQILAKLNHPSIAQLYDAGETEEGWPYLVMEYVDGSPIDEYCADNSLGIDDRVALLMDVADAVQFAHARLIVHRDLKPSNVMVDKSGKLKLLDFGIAKLLEDEAEDITRARAMTPRYASPEQLLGQSISIASDVYQLGLLMAKVLGGSLPTEGETLTDAIQRSAEGRLLTLPDTVRRSLPDEIALIVEQCLRADPVDRYRDSNYLRDDLEAYLTGHPVSAVGQRSGYRLKKFVQRNSGGVLSAMLTLLALISATIITGVKMVEAEQQRDIAVYQQQRVQASNEFYSLLLEEMGDGSFTAVDLLDRGKELLQDQFGSGQPFMASVLFDVSRRYSSLGERQREAELLREAERISREHGDHNVLATVLCKRARLSMARDPDGAARLLAEGLALYESLSSPEIETSVDCLRARSRAEVQAGETEEALATLFVAKSHLDAHAAPGTNLRGLILNDIGFRYFSDGEPVEALRYVDDVLELLESSGRGATLGYQRVAANKAVLLNSLGRTPDALAAFDDVTRRMRSSGFNGRGAASLLAQYSNLLASTGHPDEAEALIAEGLTLAEADGNDSIAAYLNTSLANVHIVRSEFEKADQSLDAAFAYIEKDQRTDPQLAMSIRVNRVRVYRGTGELDIAAREVEALLVDAGYPETRKGPGMTPALSEGTRVYSDLGDYVKASTLVNGLIERLEENMRPGVEGSIHLGRAFAQRARIKLDSGSPAEALSDVDSALPHLVYTLGEDHPEAEAARDLREEVYKAGASN